MIGFLVRGKVRVKIRFRVRVRVGLRLTLAFITGATVAGANVIHSPDCYKFLECVPSKMYIYFNGQENTTLI